MPETQRQTDTGRVRGFSKRLDKSQKRLDNRTSQPQHRFAKRGRGMDTENAGLAVEQARLNSMLTRGIVYSIVWLAGFGSSYALYQGLRARRMLKLNPMLQGNGRAWWCILAGGLGVAALCAVVGVGIFNAVTQP